ncbi:DNA-dependent protein kinase catalytic subunit [Gossypium australe]|uniref:DNA-dependent protein kinase catalytic subunit n=1 Tax=Gossypium australe TaxID=47621 RepID=A0A5B6VLL5_9ROSI|nr:DNA-dependent protein kinase catalytic subunit [Gossypium australe]
MLRVIRQLPFKGQRRLNLDPYQYGAEEFRATVDDDPEKAEFWIENTIRVLDELSCTPAECLKCVISLLRDTAYQWWNTLVPVVPRERVTWEFFQVEFRKKYISQRFLDQKHKEFLELKQGMTVIEYEREFVWLSKYAREYASTEEIMCKRFVDRVNEDIKLLVGILELKEFVVQLPEKDQFQITRLGNTAKRGRPPRNVGNVTSSRGTTKDSAMRFEAKAVARAYAIRAHEEASSPDVITGTFSLYDTNVIELIDLRSNHSYICMNLVFSKNFPIESTEFVIKVSILVGKVCKNYPLMTQGYWFSADLMLLQFDEFDVILGMDWLTLYDVVVNCRRKIIELRCQNCEILRIESDGSSGLPIVISSMSAQRCVRKGCKVYLAYILDTKVSGVKIGSVPIVCEFLNVFPEEFPALPPIKEFDFAIELVPETSSVLIALYRMAPTELK